MLLSCGCDLRRAGCFESEMDEIAIACRRFGYVCRRRFLRIERGEVGREREPTPFGVRIEKCLPARTDQVSRGAPNLDRLTAGVCLWPGPREHLEPEDDPAQGEPSSCGLRD